MPDLSQYSDEELFNALQPSSDTKSIQDYSDEELTQSLDTKPIDENKFQEWYKIQSTKLGLNPDPDDPRHFYDYRAAFKVGVEPDETGHFPSEFKKEGHPNQIIDGIDTITGEPTQELLKSKSIQDYSDDELLEMEKLTLPEPQVQDIPEYKPQAQPYDPTQGELGGTPLGLISPPPVEVGRILGGVARGALGTVEGMAGAAQWLTSGKIGKDLAGKMQEWQKNITPEEVKLRDHIYSGFGSMATFFIPGTGVAKGASMLARVAPQMALYFGIATSTALEALTEAGSTYRQSLGDKKSVKEAESAANKTFWGNLPLLAVTNKLGVFGEKGGKLFQTLMGAGMEATQESGQEIISSLAQNKDLKLKDIATAGLVGGVTGGGVKMLTATTQQEKITPDIKEDVKKPRLDTKPLPVPEVSKPSALAPPASVDYIERIKAAETREEFSVIDKEIGKMSAKEILADPELIKAHTAKDKELSKTAEDRPIKKTDVKSIIEGAGAIYGGKEVTGFITYTEPTSGSTTSRMAEDITPEIIKQDMERMKVEGKKPKVKGETQEDIKKILAEAKVEAEKPEVPLPTLKEVREAIKPTEKPLPKEEVSKLKARKWQVEMAKEPETPKTINKTNIMTWAEKAFKVPLKMKATHKWKAAGVYYPRQQIVRMKKWGELSVVTHEIAHHIDLTTLKKQFPAGWRKGQLGFQKELGALDYDQKQRRTTEGFAEYMRHRLTTGQEKTLAPKFDKFFNEFLDKNPGLKSNLTQFKEKLDVWHKQGAENRIIEHIDWKGEHTKAPFLSKVQKAWKFINEKFNDEFYTPQKIVKQIEKITGKKLRPTKNPATMMEYSKSKAGAIARTFALEKAIDEYGNVIGPGLVEILKPIPNKEMKQFISYAVSKRAVNLNKRKIESGFDIDDANFIIDKYKDKGWDKTVEELTNWSDHLLGWVFKAGGIDAKTVLKIKIMNPIYLPFKRAFLDELAVERRGDGGLVDTGTGIKTIKGSGRPIINPIESMIAQARELIAKAQKIRIARLFIDLAENEGVGGFISRVPAPMKATKFNASQLKSYLDSIAGEKGEMSSNEYDDMLTVFTQDFQYHGKENIVSVWKDGKQVFYEIHPDLYESFKGIDTLKLGPVAKMIAPFARILRLGATGLKVSFGLARNPFRDALSYVVFSKRKTATVFDPILGYYKDITTKPGEPTWRFKALGGALSGQIGLDRSATMATYDELLLDKLGKKGKALKVVKHPLTAIRDLLSVTEMGPRSVEVEKNYKKYLKERPDWSEEDAFVQAFNDAQDVTVNFTKSGKWAKQINEITAFFNITIRGPEKIHRSFKENPIQTTVKGLAWLTLLALGSWYKNKDKDWYVNLPRAYKYNNLFFEIGDNVFRLPVPFDLGSIFMSAPQAALDYYEGDDESFKAMAEIAKSQVPDPTPSAFGPLIDVAKNKNYLGIPIESEGMQYLYHTERKKYYTSDFAVKMSKGLDKIGVKVSPIQFEYLMNSYSGGFLRQFKISGERVQDYPVIGDLMLRDPNSPRRQLNEYFSDYEVLKQKKQAGIATREERHKLNKISRFYSKYKQISKKMVLAKKMKNYQKLDSYYKQMKNELTKYGYK